MFMFQYVIFIFTICIFKLTFCFSNVPIENNDIVLNRCFIHKGS